MTKSLQFIFLLLFALSCSSDKKNIPQIGFLDLLQDETLSQAKIGFFDALKKEGFSEEEKTVSIIYRNAQNDQPSLLQACDYLISKNVDLIATNPTLSTIVAVQRTKDIPVFMMVSPKPDIAGLTNKKGEAPVNLFGVYETLEYIDTSLMLISNTIPDIKSIGTIYNQSEPQSMDAFRKIKNYCIKNNIELLGVPVNNSNETQLVVQSILNKNIDVFFALPDNVVFSSIEVIVSSCDQYNVPVFTSEEGLVRRGALAAFGADMYRWGYQSGLQAARYLKSNSLSDLSPEIVQFRKKVYNEEKAKKFQLSFDSTFTAVK